MVWLEVINYRETIVLDISNFTGALAEQISDIQALDRV